MNNETRASSLFSQMTARALAGLPPEEKHKKAYNLADVVDPSEADASTSQIDQIIQSYGRDLKKGISQNREYEIESAKLSCGACVASQVMKL